MTVTVTDRIVGCLKGIATGDAIGKQAEMLSHDEVLHWYPHGIRGFEGTPGAIISRYAGNSKHEWRIGETTDDTEGTVAVARAIITERNVSHLSVGREMLRCTKSVHPGVKSLWEFHQAADAARIATVHDNLRRLPRLRPVEVAARHFPNQPLTIVPLALGLATVMESAEEAILLATNIGGDSDSVASIAGGILGAMYPISVNDHWYTVVEQVNDHDLVTVADQLAQPRH